MCHRQKMNKYMARFINPFTDMGFKRIFGQAINKDLLIDFLNALLEGERSIKDITFWTRSCFLCTGKTGASFMIFTVRTRMENNS